MKPGYKIRVKSDLYWVEGVFCMHVRRIEMAVK
jgi:hypothetical protein